MFTQILQRSRMAAIVRLDDLSMAHDLTHALLGAGVRLIEFTLTNPEAPRVVSQLRATISRLDGVESAIGIGSIRTVEQAKLAIDSGSQFLVAPVFSAAVVALCKRHSIAVAPGAFTPTEIATAWDAGADVVKVFPARSLGPNFIRDVLAPMPELQLMPTGGIDLNNVASYFQAGAVGVGIGSQLLPKVALETRDWNEVQRVAAQYVTACAIPSDMSHNPT